MRLSDQQRLALRAVVDRVVPEDQWPSAGALGAVEYLESSTATAINDWWPALVDGLDNLDARARAQAGRSFADLGPGAQDRLLLGLQDAEAAPGEAAPGGGPVAAEEDGPSSFFPALVRFVSEAYYSGPVHGANPGGASWAMVGYPSPVLASPMPSRLPHVVSDIGQVLPSYDVVVVGAGAGGGVAAYVLSRAGLAVLVIERGEALDAQQVGADHLRNQRFSRLGHNAGPALVGNPRVAERVDGRRRTVAPHEPAWHNDAMTLGGGTRVWGAQAWRFTPTDFRLASTYGVPENSTLADWPISYEDLEPYYGRVEWAMGVAGDTGHANMGQRRRGYPMPALSGGLAARVLGTGAKRLGWRTAPVPLMVNSVPYNGRAACIRCPQCIGFACPVDAKTGTQNSVLVQAAGTGRCTVLVGTRAVALRRGNDGLACAVAVRSESGSDGLQEIRCRSVVVAAGAIESARLLMLSGMGGPMVGCNLQGHTYVGAQGLFDDIVCDTLGPGPQIATTELLHGRSGIMGGGILADEFVKTPAIFWHWGLPPDAPRWGPGAKEAMRHGFLRTLHVQGPVQEVPVASCRAQLDEGVVDHLGLPVVRLSGRTHPANRPAMSLMSGKAQEWLEASGAVRVWPSPSLPRPASLSAGQHQAGTCRMGDDPSTSVCDPTGALHDVGNVVLTDASVHVTNGGVNPGLTIMALAWRSAELLAARLS